MVDTMITLHESTETSFTTNGLGALSDAILCEVTEERNGEFELEMEYPVTGIRYKELQLRRIIMAKPNPYSDSQPFRIYAITKPINGIVTVNAAHISYDMSGYPVSAFVADTIQNAFINMKSASAVNCPFSFSTDKTTTANMKVVKPSSMRSLLGGVEGSILDTYGGEYEFDKYNVKLWNKRGADRGVSIRYGKNLTDLKQEENCSSVYTGVYPFWYSEQEGLVQLDEKILKAPGTYNFTRIYPLDLSQKWTNKPTREQLKSTATSYMNANNIGVPAVSLTVSFIQLSQSMEYSEYALLEDVHLCDTVKVEFTELNVSATAKCIKTIYDAISNKYVSIELGETRSNLASTISSQKQAISDSITKTFMQQAIENATQLISGGLGGYVIMHSSTGGKHPDEILIMDTDDIATAKKVWRWNKGGLGYSSTGYNGPYALAMTQDGNIVANFVNTGTMSANRINGGTLILGGKNNSNGTALVKDANGNNHVIISSDGITCDNATTPQKIRIKDGCVHVFGRKDGVALLTGIIDSSKPIPEASDSYDSFAICCAKNSDGLVFGRYYSNSEFRSTYIINNGRNPDGYEERHIFYETERHLGNVNYNAQILQCKERRIYGCLGIDSKNAYNITCTENAGALKFGSSYIDGDTIYYTHCYIINYGENPDGYEERHIFYGTERHIASTYYTSTMYIDTPGYIGLQCNGTIKSNELKVLNSGFNDYYPIANVGYGHSVLFDWQDDRHLAVFVDNVHVGYMTLSSS